MTIFDHPIWEYLAGYVHMPSGRDNIDLLQVPEPLRSIALTVVSNCISCGRVIFPLRARAKSKRSRVAHTTIEKRLFYAPTCPTSKDSGCARSRAAQMHKDEVRVKFGLPRRFFEVQESGPIETYDALCLQEPYLELILLGLKTLETRTKCLRKKGGEVVLTSSKTYNKEAWADPKVGGLLNDAARARALEGLGQLAGIVTFGDCRPGVPVIEDEAARIAILLPTGKPRFVFPIITPRRVKRVTTVRVRPDGSATQGSSQGFFKVPKSLVAVMG